LVLVGRRYVVKGRVQGVGFRFFVEDAARRESIRGYVRNQRDGSVEIMAEGDQAAVLRFEQAVRRGPSGARVDDVETMELDPSGRFSGFGVTG
jgi:acylphosphatase